MLLDNLLKKKIVIR